MNKQVFIVLTMVQVILGANAQSQSDTSRYFVYFKHKGEPQYPFSLADPSAFLTEQAIERRDRQNIRLDSTDLPVNPGFIDQLESTDIDVFFTSKWLNGVLIQTHSNKIETVKAMSFVDSIRKVANGPRLRKSKISVDDPQSFLQPPFIEGDTDIQLSMLWADQMHQDGLRGEGMLITVLDNGFTGVNMYSPFQHVWENNRIVGTKDFVENSGHVYQYGSHGTSVFSILGALVDTETADFVGIANQASYILCVTEDNEAENTIEEYNWIFGAEYADSLGTDIINSSLGYRTFDIEDHDYDFDDLDGNTSVITKGAEMAARKGIVVVTSAGNSGRQGAPENLISHPADADSILTVGSVAINFGRSDFSSVGPTADGRIKPDVAAFGDATTVVRGDGSISRGSGTSFASPLIAGFAAGIWQANPDWTSQKVIQAIKNSGHKVHSKDNLLGNGVPNYNYAVNGSMKVLQVDDILENKVTIYPNPFNEDTLYLAREGEFSYGLQVKIINPKGLVVLDKSFKKEEVSDEIKLTIKDIQPGVYFLILRTDVSERTVKLINF